MAAASRPIEGLQGVHPKVVQERLGHSQTSITLDTYSHVLDMTPSGCLVPRFSIHAAFQEAQGPEDLDQRVECDEPSGGLPRLGRNREMPGGGTEMRSGQLSFLPACSSGGGRDIAMELAARVLEAAHDLPGIVDPVSMGCRRARGIDRGEGALGGS